MNTPLPDVPVHSVTTVSPVVFLGARRDWQKFKPAKKEKNPSKTSQQTECARPALCRHKNHICHLQNQMGAGIETPPQVHKRDQNQLPRFQKSLLSLFRTSGMWFCSSYVTGTLVPEATCVLGPYSSKSKAAAWQEETKKGGKKNEFLKATSLLCCFSALIWLQQG